MSSTTTRPGLMPLIVTVWIAWFAAMAAGCDTVTRLIETAPMPSASLTGARLTSLSLDAVGLEFDVQVRNPYSVGLPIVGTTLGLESGGAAIASGSIPSEGPVPARGSKRVTLPVEVNLTELMSVLRGVKPGQVVPYKAVIELTVDAPVAGTVTLPVETKGELPVPAVPGVRLAGIEWTELSLLRATAVTRLRVENNNRFSVDLRSVQCQLNLAGRSVGELRTQDALSLDGGNSGELEVPLSVSPTEMGMSLLGLLRGTQSGYELTGRISVGTPFGPIEMPFGQSGQVSMRQGG